MSLSQPSGAGGARDEDIEEQHQLPSLQPTCLLHYFTLSTLADEDNDDSTDDHCDTPEVMMLCCSPRPLSQPSGAGGEGRGQGRDTSTASLTTTQVMTGTLDYNR